MLLMCASYGKQFKIILIGDATVGKTSIRRRYLGKVFKTNYIPTIGVDFAQKHVNIDGEHVFLVIWDIAGQPLFSNLRRHYYEGSSGIALVYSVIDRKSFENASKWLVEAYEFMRRLPPILIIGNKIDLRDTAGTTNGMGLCDTVGLERPVTTEEGKVFTKILAEKMKTECEFIETSALTEHNIEQAFVELVRMMLRTYTTRR